MQAKPRADFSINNPIIEVCTNTLKNICTYDQSVAFYLRIQIYIESLGSFFALFENIFFFMLQELMRILYLGNKLVPLLTPLPG